MRGPWPLSRTSHSSRIDRPLVWLERLSTIHTLLGRDTHLGDRHGAFGELAELLTEGTHLGRFEGRKEARALLLAGLVPVGPQRQTPHVRQIEIVPQGIAHVSVRRGAGLAPRWRSPGRSRRPCSPGPAGRSARRAGFCGSRTPPAVGINKVCLTTAGGLDRRGRYAVLHQRSLDRVRATYRQHHVVVGRTRGVAIADIS